MINLRKQLIKKDKEIIKLNNKINTLLNEIKHAGYIFNWCTYHITNDICIDCRCGRNKKVKLIE